MDTTKNKMKLSYNACMVLGLIAEGIRYGYELNKTLEERGMRYWTRLSKKGIYLVLQQLARDGYITAKTEHTTPAKITYTITNKGRAHLKSMVAAGLASQQITTFDYTVPVALLSVLPKDTALRQIRERRAWLTTFVQDIPPENTTPNTLGKRANIRFLRQHYTLEIEWLTWLETELERSTS